MFWLSPARKERPESVDEEVACRSDQKQELLHDPHKPDCILTFAQNIMLGTYSRKALITTAVSLSRNQKTDAFVQPLEGITLHDLAVSHAKISTGPEECRIRIYTAYLSDAIHSRTPVLRPGRLCSHGTPQSPLSVQ